MPILPSLSFSASPSFGGWRRFAPTLALTAAALVYGLTIGDAGLADALSAVLREGAAQAASRLGAGSSVTLFVAACLGTLGLPVGVLMIVWARAGTAYVQASGAWLAQAIVNLSLYVLGASYEPLGEGVAVGVRMEGLLGAGLLGYTIPVSSVLFGIGVVVFATMLLLPLRVAAMRAHENAR